MPTVRTLSTHCQCRSAPVQRVVPAELPHRFANLQTLQGVQVGKTVGKLRGWAAGRGGSRPGEDEHLVAAALELVLDAPHVRPDAALGEPAEERVQPGVGFAVDVAEQREEPDLHA